MYIGLGELRRCIRKFVRGARGSCSSPNESMVGRLVSGRLCESDFGRNVQIEVVIRYCCVAQDTDWKPKAVRFLTERAAERQRMT